MATELETPTVTRQELATLLGLSSARIGQMVGEGIIPGATAHGRYLLAQCVKRYCEHTRSDLRSKGSMAFTDARTRWMESKARRARLEEEVLTAKYIPVSVMDAGWAAIVRKFADQLFRVPSCWP